MGWDIDDAREIKTRAARRAGELLADRDPAVSAHLGGVTTVGAPGPQLIGVALGLRPLAEGEYGLAVRYRLGTPTARMVARRLASEFGAEAGADVDVRHTGRVRLLSSPVLPASLATENTGRSRPLRPGISVAHVSVTAGTIGAFVTWGGVPHVLSNHHVLVGDAGQVGDVVVQPGPADGGSDPTDRIGSLAAFIPLQPEQTAMVDAALASIEELWQEGQALADVLAPDYPVGNVEGVATAEGDEAVEKIGRTTGITQGRVTAIEIDGVLVDFGARYGTLSFDGQIEVESTMDGPFSLGGDSGSLVYRPDTRQAVGLLFAGSDQGGSNGYGLTYLNPIGAVLETLDAELITSVEDYPTDPGDDPQDPDPGDGPEDGPGLGEALERGAAVALKAGIRSQVAAIPGVCGVGLQRVGSKFVVVVNVENQAVVDRLPAAVRETVDVRVTGPIVAR